VRQLRSERNGTASLANAITPDQRKIQALEKRIKRIGLEKEILKKATAYLMSDSMNNLRLIDELKESYAVTLICQAFEIHRSSYKYWLKRSDRV